MVILAIFLWPNRRHSKAIAFVILPGAFLFGITIWAISIHVARLPRAAIPIPGQSTLVHKVLAVSPTEAFLYSGDVVRISLPEGRVTARYQTDDRVYVLPVSFAAHDDVLLFTYVDGSKHGGWAAIKGSSWLVKPRRFKTGPLRKWAYWDDDKKRFVLASLLRSEIKRRGENGKALAIIHPIEMQYVDMGGNVTDGTSLRIEANNSNSIAFDGFCRVGDTQYLVDFFGDRVCPLVKNDEAAVKCAPVKTGQKHRISCPGQLYFLPPSGYLTKKGIRQIALPPKRFFDRAEPTAASIHISLGAEGLQPEIVWYTKNSGYIRSVGEGFFSARIISGEEARNLGHVEHGVLLELWDKEGERISHTYIRRMSLASLLFVAGDEIVVMDPEISSIVRLDRRTLVRLNDLSVVDAVRERLSVWGGHSYLFEVAIGFSLLGVVVLLLFVLVGVLRSGREVMRITLQRVSLVYLLVAVPALFELISRAWHI